MPVRPKQLKVMARKSVSWEKIAVFSFGVIFISVLLALVVLLPKVSAEAYTVFRIVIALAAAGVGAIIPGFLDVHMKGLLRAGGAMALFVVVYFFSPPPPSSSPQPPMHLEGDGARIAPPIPPAESPDKTVSDWLALIDEFRYADARLASSDATKAAYSESTFVDVFSKTRTALGPVKERVLKQVQTATHLPNGDIGTFRVFNYLTTFSDDGRYVETVVVTAEGGRWRVLGHNINQLPKGT
jgi:hypothetical protein